MNRVRGLSCRALLGTASAGAIVALLTIPALTQTRPQAPKIGDPPEALNMRLVGHNDLQARTAYQPTIFKQGGRYFRPAALRASPVNSRMWMPVLARSTT